MKYALALITSLALPLTVLPAAAPLPPFSWDNVPVYAHVGKQSDDFTPAQLDFLAKHYNFITIEKGQASRKRGSTEAGFAEAARQIKRRNPEAKVLFYWNTFLDIPGYKARREFPVDGHLKDRRDQPVMVRKTLSTYDLSHADVRAWWSDTPAKAVRAAGAEGIFADALGQVTAPGKHKLLGGWEISGIDQRAGGHAEEITRKARPGQTGHFQRSAGRQRGRVSAHDQWSDDRTFWLFLQ